MTEYATTYGRMNDEQLLNVAKDRDSLCPEALVALKTELTRRNFGQLEIDQQAESVRQLRTDWDNRGDLGRSFNGFGTSIYGKRNFQRDGSFTTTQWIILFWIPFIPLKSFRVREAGLARPAFLGWSKSYFVLTRSRPDIRQVINVYAFIAAITNFSALKIYSYQWSQDGKNIAFVRGESPSDLVLIQDAQK